MWGEAELEQELDLEREQLAPGALAPMKRVRRAITPPKRRASQQQPTTTQPPEPEPEMLPQELTPAVAAGAWRDETFTEAQPLGMTFAQAQYEGTQEMYIHLSQIRPGGQGAARGLGVGMRLLKVDGWPVEHGTYDEAVAKIKRRPVTLTFIECESGRVLHADDAAAAAALVAAPVASPLAEGGATSGELRQLVEESAAVRQEMAKHVAESRALLAGAEGAEGATDVAQRGLDLAEHSAAVEATLQKLRTRMAPA